MTERTVFGDCSLSRDGLLATPGGRQQLSCRLASILRDLVQAGGDAVHTDHLLDTHWGPGSVSTQSLPKSIFQLRRAIAGTRVVRIDSVYGYGYRLRIASSQSDGPTDADKALAICEEASHRMHELRDASLSTASAMYLQALKLDPYCACATVGYAQMQAQRMTLGLVSTREGWPPLRHMLEEAMQEEAQSADVHAVLAKGQCFYDWDTDAAQTSIEAALRLAPADYLPNECAARISLFHNQPDDAITYARRAIEASPMTARSIGVLAYALGYRGEAHEAIERIDEIYRLDPGNQELQAWYIWVQAMHGDAERACEVGAALQAQLPGMATITALHALAHARAGHAPQARAILKTLEDENEYATRGNTIASFAWCALGDKPAALGALEAAARDREYWLGFTLHHPGLGDLRTEPRHQAIRDSMFSSTGR